MTIALNILGFIGMIGCIAVVLLFIAAIGEGMENNKGGGG